jgi:rSAM/selenodomain-associated transferase 1
VLFTKPARPGRVKTRLIAPASGGEAGLTAEQAADLHRAFREDLTSRLESGRFDLVLAWALDPDEPIPGTGTSAVRQAEGDLGERLFEGLSAAARRHRFVGAVGSDHPELEIESVERGFSLLRGGVDVVLGPALDGGYYFVGVRAEVLDRALFSGIAWSTATVLAETVERCRASGLSFMLLAEGADVDTMEDLERLQRRLGDVRDPLSADCPKTAELVRAWETA